MTEKADKWIDVAESQAGAISQAQLAAFGVSRHQAQTLEERRILTRIRRGVFVLPGSNPGWPRPLWIGLLAAGPHSFAWSRTAAGLWELDGARPGDLDIGVGPGHHPRSPGVSRLSWLEPSDVVSRNGIRVTTVVRTLADLGRAASDAVVERSVESALRAKLVSEQEVRTEAQRARCAGVRALQRVLAVRPPGAVPTESDAETLFLLIAREAGLPEPKRQVTVILRGRKYRIDFAWPALRLAVEIDGSGVHGPSQLGADLRRQNQILLDGWLVLRFTWQMVAHDPASVIRDLRAAWELLEVSRGWRS